MKAQVDRIYLTPKTITFLTLKSYPRRRRISEKKHTHTCEEYYYIKRSLSKSKHTHTLPHNNTYLQQTGWRERARDFSIT